jgi:hypothetical protein
LYVGLQFELNTSGTFISQLLKNLLMISYIPYCKKIHLLPYLFTY